MKAFVVVGLGFGDEGKGSIVDYLVRRHNAKLVVRYNGGAQAAHHVVAPDGREHTFAQFGAGTLVPGVRTHLSEYVVVNPLNLIREGKALVELGVTDAFTRLTIDARALIVTPWHISLNRANEAARGWRRHGSCGQGIGEARADQIGGAPTVTMADLVAGRRALVSRLRAVRDRKIEQLRAVEEWATDLKQLYHPSLPNTIADHYLRIRALVLLGTPRVRGTVVFEGAQGVLLDERHGFPPHHTWTDTTAANAYRLADLYGVEERHTVGVIRAYATRHGAGPFPTEDAELTAALPDDTNAASPYQGPFRVGFPDLVLLRYALGVCPVDSLAVTCMDRVSRIARDEWKICVAYYDPGYTPNRRPRLKHAAPVYQPLRRIASAYRDVLPAPVSIWSYGPSWDDKAQT